MQFPSKSSKIAVLGAGTWGMTLSWLLSGPEKRVSLWSRDAFKREQLRSTRKVLQPTTIEIPPAVEICDEIEQCVKGAEVVLFCCSAQSMREVAQLVAQALPAKVGAGSKPAPGGGDAVLVSAAKGLELGTLARMSQVLEDILPGYAVCALSGPNLALEVLQKLPTASVVACADEGVARFVQYRLSAPTFRLYTNTDVVGVEMGGALKNIIAIAAGCGDGFKLGTNAKAALMTRGLAEMVRLSGAMGARAITLSGLAGIGDLIATCYSSLSRNYRLGFKLAQGESLEKIQAELSSVAEGATTVHAVCELSQKLAVQMPIAEQVAATLKGLTTAEQAINSLMSRPPASE